MALWEKLGSRGNVEDRRGFGPTGVGGGLGLTGIVIYLLFNYFTGGTLEGGLNQLQNVQVQNQSSLNSTEFDGNDSYEVFASTVLGSTNDMWSDLFRQSGNTYIPPKLVLFRTSTQSTCGGAVSQSGPHYCPLDDTIYLDETFFNELETRFGAKGGDVAEAYVIAHEAAHSAQNKLGIMDQVNNLRENPNIDSNDISVRLELQADCFAGLWAYSIKDKGVFEQNEITEAIDAASAVGDDRIQKKVSGRVNPETWTHGSSEDRVKWFNIGYNTGSLAFCDTFK